jgi:hypothetical protein
MLIADPAKLFRPVERRGRAIEVRKILRDVAAAASIRPLVARLRGRALSLSSKRLTA